MLVRAPNFVGVASSVSKILLLFVFLQICFWTASTMTTTNEVN